MLTDEIFPTTQNQWINLLVGGGTRLMGGLPALRDHYKFSTNPAYTLASVNAFGASALAGAPNPALLKQAVFNEFKPESMSSMELGYKALWAKKLLVDFNKTKGKNPMDLKSSFNYIVDSWGKVFFVLIGCLPPTDAEP